MSIMTFEQYAALHYPQYDLNRAKWAVVNNALQWQNYCQQATKTTHNGRTLLKFPNGMTVLFDNHKDIDNTIGDGRIFCELRDHHGDIERFSTADEFYLWLTRYF